MKRTGGKDHSRRLTLQHHHISAHVEKGFNAQKQEGLQESVAVNVSGTFWLHRLNPLLVT